MLKCDIEYTTKTGENYDGNAEIFEEFVHIEITHFVVFTPEERIQTDLFENIFGVIGPMCMGDYHPLRHLDT